MKGSCNDSNPKIISRIYDLNGVMGKFKLCKDCSLDPDFSDFISETPIKQISNSEVLQK